MKSFACRRASKLAFVVALFGITLFVSGARPSLADDAQSRGQTSLESTSVETFDAVADFMLVSFDRIVATLTGSDRQPNFAANTASSDSSTQVSRDRRVASNARGDDGLQTGRTGGDDPSGPWPF